MGCIQGGNTTDECSLMALELLPLSFWRNVTADTARASFGSIFFIVEITKGYLTSAHPATTPSEIRADGRDFWRALKERHPFALTFARGPRSSTGTTSPMLSPIKSEHRPRQRISFPHMKLAPILPSRRIRLSFLRRQPSISHPLPPPTAPTPPLQLPQYTYPHNDLRMHHHTYPHTHHQSWNYTPRIYLHTPTWQLSGEGGREARRRLSLPSQPSPTTLGGGHVGDEMRGRNGDGREGSRDSSTRVSLLSIATDSLALQSVLDGRKGSEEEI
jgi:hypothetical protein